MDEQDLGLRIAELMLEEGTFELGIDGDVDCPPLHRPEQCDKKGPRIEGKGHNAIAGGDAEIRKRRGERVTLPFEAGKT